MKVIWKNIVILSTCVLVILSILSLLGTGQVRAILHIPESHYSIDNVNSQLLDLLILPDDLKRDFSWSYIQVNQTDFAESEDENVSIVETASSALGGFYQGKSISILTRAKKLNFENISETINMDIFNAQFSHPPSRELVNLNLTKISSEQKYKCSYSFQDETSCTVGIISSDKVIFLEIQVSALLNQSSVEELLNLLLGEIMNDMGYLPTSTPCPS